MKALKTLFAAPVRDYLGLIDGLARGTAVHWALLILGMVAGWWLYVPAHELLHAVGCLVSGGQVTELQVAEIYGGGLLATWIPWVTAGSDYAGQLTGFDTHGNDFIYLSTVLAPYVLTVFPGVWLVRRLAPPPTRLGTLAAGLGLSAALAPFISLTGDLYETGSIVITALLGPGGDPSALTRYRGDDLFLLIQELNAGGTDAAGWGIVVLSTLLGLLLAFAIYALGSLLASRLLRRRGKAPSAEH